MNQIKLEISDKEANILAYLVASQKEFNAFTVHELLALHDKINDAIYEAQI